MISPQKKIKIQECSRMKMGRALKQMLVIPALVATAMISMPAAAAAGDTAAKPPPMEAGKPASPSAEEFVRSRCDAGCASTGWNTLCAQLLLPYAGAVDGGEARLVQAAAAVLLPQLQGFADDVPRILAEKKRPSADADACLGKLKEAMAGVSELAAKLGPAAGAGEMGKPEKADAAKWFASLDEKYSDCVAMKEVHDDVISDLPNWMKMADGTSIAHCLFGDAAAAPGAAAPK
ncbi:hypothetical protein ACP4OV_022834 [Aristida adscensionis]